MNYMMYSDQELEKKLDSTMTALQQERLNVHNDLDELKKELIISWLQKHNDLSV